MEFPRKVLAVVVWVSPPSLRISVVSQAVEVSSPIQWLELLLPALADAVASSSQTLPFHWTWALEPECVAEWQSQEVKLQVQEVLDRLTSGNFLHCSVLSHDPRKLPHETLEHRSENHSLSSLWSRLFVPTCPPQFYVFLWVSAQLQKETIIWNW